MWPELAMIACQEPGAAADEKLAGPPLMLE